MQTFAIYRSNGWSSPDEVQAAAERSGKVLAEMSDRVKWLRSYITSDPETKKFGTICIYEAKDADSVREHARRAQLPVDAVVPVVDTVIINQEAASK